MSEGQKTSSFFKNLNTALLKFTFKSKKDENPQITISCVQFEQELEKDSTYEQSHLLLLLQFGEKMLRRKYDLSKVLQSLKFCTN